MELNPEKLKSIGLEGFSPMQDMMILSNSGDDYAVVKITDDNIEQVDIMKSAETKEVESDKADKDMENNKAEKEMVNEKMSNKMSDEMKESMKSMIDEAVKGYMNKMENKKAKEIENQKSYSTNQEQTKEALKNIQVKRVENSTEKVEANKQSELVEKYKEYIVRFLKMLLFNSILWRLLPKIVSGLFEDA